MQQHTLCGSVQTAGIGLHSAREVKLSLHPAPPDTGIVFLRSDCEPPVEIPAQLDRVTSTTRATTLSNNGVSVATVEHLLAALRGMGVDNALVKVSCMEVPIMDGSAEPFVQLIQSVGLCGQPASRHFLLIREEVSVTEGDKTALFRPYDGFRIVVAIDFEQPVFKRFPSTAELEYSPAQFAGTTSRARTFGLMHELEYLQARGLALGGSFDNAVVLDEDRVLNQQGLRSEDELVQHKVLDAMGDLALARYPIIGEYRAFKPGHTLNHAALEALLARPDAWEVVTFEGDCLPPPGYRIDLAGG